MDGPVRKNLETILVDQDAALRAALADYSYPVPAEIPIRWPNKDWTDQHEIYLRPTFTAGSPSYNELGRNSRKDVRGEFLIGIYTPAQAGLDMPDDLAKVIALAYPYGLELVTDAGTVEITGVAKRQGMPADGRYYTPVHINWTLWRAS